MGAPVARLSARGDGLRQGNLDPKTKPRRFDGSTSGSGMLSLMG